MAKTRVGGAAKGWLDVAMAALCGGSIAFAMFAMPNGNFETLVGMSGLAQLTDAAQPPLGQTARIAAAAGSGAIAFGLVWLLLRALGRPAKPKKRKLTLDEEVSMAPPRLRRVDSHPDAPSRRPLFAGSELGEPEGEAEEAEAEAAEDLWEPEPQPEPLPEPAISRPMPRFLAAALEQPQEEPELTEIEPDWEPEPEPVAFYEEPEPEAEPEPEPEAELQPEPQPEPQSWEPEPLAAPEPEAEPTISELMQRLERGISGRHFTPPAPQPAVNDRLRNALDELQKMARKG
jgi:hypothetical protein